MYSKEQKATALVVFHQTNSVSETIRILGYPTKKTIIHMDSYRKHGEKGTKTTSPVCKSSGASKKPSLRH